MKIFVLSIIFIVFLFTYSIDIDLEFQGIPSQTNQFTIKEDTLLFGVTGNAIEVYNIKNGNLDLLNRQYFTKQYMYNVEIFDTFLFVSYAMSYRKKIDIFNISNPLNIIYIDSLIGRKYFEIYDTLFFTFDYNTASDPCTLYIYNISDVALINTITKKGLLLSQKPEKFMIYQDTLLYPYVNISDLLNPVELNLDSLINPCIIEDSFVFGSQNSIYAIYNANNVTNTFFLDTIIDFNSNSTPYTNFYKSDTILFINYKGNGSSESKILNISNYFDIKDIYQFNSLNISPSRIENFGIIGVDSFLFINRFNEGIYEYNVNDPANPVLINNTEVRIYEYNKDENSTNNSIILNNSYFTSNGKYIFKKGINDTNSFLYEYFENDNSILNITQMDTFFIFASIYDSANIKISLINLNLQVLNTYLINNDSLNVNVQLIPINDTLFYYIENKAKICQLLKISNSIIEYITNINNLNILDYIIVDNRLYGLDKSSGGLFLEYDITDPINPVKIDSINIVIGDNVEIYKTLKQQKHYIYYFSSDYDFTGNDTIYCFDISDNNSLSIENYIGVNAPNEFINIDFCNNYLILHPNINIRENALIYDVSNPLNPILVDSSIYFNGFTIASSVNKNYIYISDFYAGLNKIRIGNEGAELICGDSLLFETDSIKGIYLYNTGGANIVIDSVSGIDSPFELITVLPETIDVNDSILLELKCNDLSVGNLDSMYIYSNDIYKIYNKVYVKNEENLFLPNRNEKYTEYSIDRIFLNKNILELYVSKDSDVNIDIYNSLGQKKKSIVKYYRKGKYKIDFDELIEIKGVYFIKIHLNNLIYKKKFIKI